MKKWISALVLGLALIGLAACAPKSAEDIVKTELKDSYTGHSENPGYEYPFIEGNDELTFNKKENSITNSQGKMRYFSVLSDNEIPSDTKKVIATLENNLKGTSNFTIIISRDENPTIKQAEALYQISLSEGGKKIRIFELRRNARDYGYYDFKGQAK